MLIVENQEHFDSVRDFARSVGAGAELQRHLDFLAGFGGEHHNHDSLRDGGIARVRRVIDEVTVVIIDLEQHFDAIYGEDRAVVLAIRVIVIGECIESRDCSEDTRNGSESQCLNSRSDHDAATPPKAAELIIHRAYAS